MPDFLSVCMQNKLRYSKSEVRKQKEIIDAQRMPPYGGIFDIVI